MTKKRIIVKEAARLFAEKGFSATSTAEIAEAAGVAQGTLFYHFSTKQGILHEIYENLISEYLEVIAKMEKEPGTGLESLIKMIEFHFEFAAENWAEFTVLHRDIPQQIRLDGCKCENVRKNSEQSIAIMKSAIARGIKDGSIRADADADGYARLMKAMLIGTARMTKLHMIEFNSPMQTMREFCVNALAIRG